MSAYHDFSKPFKILEGKKVGDMIFDDKTNIIEFLILRTGKWYRFHGFGDIEEVTENIYLIKNIPWQNKQ